MQPFEPSHSGPNNTPGISGVNRVQILGNLRQAGFFWRWHGKTGKNTKRQVIGVEKGGKRGIQGKPGKPGEIHCLFCFCLLLPAPWYRVTLCRQWLICLQQQNVYYVKILFVTPNEPHPKPWITGQAVAKHRATKGNSKNGRNIGVDVGKIG